LPQLSELELFLLTTPNDTEEAPWMVMADVQVRDVDLLKSILRLHIEQRQLPWYLASYLKITMRRPVTGEPLEAAPDLLVTEGEERLRTSWNIAAEGKPPLFVLEVASTKSWGRDTRGKPQIYAAMGVAEYAIFAPERKRGPQLFGYRRDAAGQFVDWRADRQGVLRSRALGGLGFYVEERLWLRALDAEGRRLRTSHEQLAEEAAARDAEAAARRDAERRAAAETAARAQVEAEVARLREELRQLRADLGIVEER